MFGTPDLLPLRSWYRVRLEIMREKSPGRILITWYKMLFIKREWSMPDLIEETIYEGWLVTKLYNQDMDYEYNLHSVRSVLWFSLPLGLQLPNLTFTLICNPLNTGPSWCWYYPLHEGIIICTHAFWHFVRTSISFCCLIHFFLILLWIWYISRVQVS